MSSTNKSQSNLERIGKLNISENNSKVVRRYRFDSLSVLSLHIQNIKFGEFANLKSGRLCKNGVTVIQ